MDKSKLKDIINYVADKQGFRSAIIEKDYHLTRILNAVNQYLSCDIIFKGGTLLNKAYLNYHRLSEDLDFSYSNDVDVSTRGKRSKAIASIRKNGQVQRLLQQRMFITNQDRNTQRTVLNKSTLILPSVIIMEAARAPIAGFPFRI